MTTKTTAAKTRYYADLDDAAEAAQAKANKTGRAQYVNHKRDGFTVDPKAAKQLMATRIPEGAETPDAADPATASKATRTAKTRAEARAADPNQNSPLGAENVKAASDSLDRLESARRATEEEYVAARKAEQARRRDEANAHITAIHERDMAAIKAANEKARRAPAKDRDVVASDAPRDDVTRCPRCGAQLVTNLKGRREYTCGCVILDKGSYTMQDKACENYRTSARIGWDEARWSEGFEIAKASYDEAMAGGADKAGKVHAARMLVDFLNEAAAQYDLPDLGDLTTKVVSGWWSKRIDAAITATRERMGAGQAPAPGAKVIPMVEVAMADGTVGLRHRDGLVVFAS